MCLESPKKGCQQSMRQILLNNGIPDIKAAVFISEIPIDEINEIIDWVDRSRRYMKNPSAILYCHLRRRLLSRCPEETLPTQVPG